MTQSPQTKRIVTVAELAQRSSLSVATLYRQMPEHLARPRKISPGRVGWPADYIDNWIAERVGGDLAVAA